MLTYLDWFLTVEMNEIFNRTSLLFDLTYRDYFAYFLSRGSKMQSDSHYRSLHGTFSNQSGTYRNTYIAAVKARIRNALLYDKDCSNEIHIHIITNFHFELKHKWIQ
ncbi:hypothetical protein V6Z12_D10G003200 [Gossypium hirsutum]